MFLMSLVKEGNVLFTATLSTFVVVVNTDIVCDSD